MSDSKTHGPMKGDRAACGRRNVSSIDHSWAAVTCVECQAARRADAAALVLAGAVR